MKNLKIVFMGTPDFAVGILDALLKANYKIVGIVTAADKPAGRGQKIKYSAVKEYALIKGIKLLQPTNLKDEHFINELKSLNANVQIVVAFRMLPEVVWKMPEFGTFNLHASLLPQYRGAAPINWAIINGETKTGVTTFFIDNKIDTGAIILNKETKIDPYENAEKLHDRLKLLGCETVLKTLELIEKGKVSTTIQKENPEIKTAYKLNKENCKIDFSKTSKEIHNLVRGLSPYPAAWCQFLDNNQEWNVKISEAIPIEEVHSNAIGSILCNKKELKIALKDGYLNIISLQMPGKKNMSAAELLNGTSFSKEAKAV